MKKLLSMGSICCLAIGLSSAPLLAQTNPQNPNQNQWQNQNQNQTSAPNRHARSALVRSGKVIGADVYDSSGKNIGQIKDIVFDENQGGQVRAVLSIGNYLGVGDKLTPVEWKYINAQPDNNGGYKYTVTASQSDLQKEQSFSDSNWPDFTNGWPGENVHGKKLVRMSEVTDREVYDQNGKQIGGIKDVVFDVRHGRVAYAAVSFSNDFINKGDQLTMVPWPVLRQSKASTTGYVLHAKKAQLDNAVYFEPSKWPNLNGLAGNRTIYDHYSVTPYNGGSGI